jgi:hypothetical protein
MKKIIISTGDKGGAGKSMTARFVGEMLYGASVPNLLFLDCDAHNPDLVDKFQNHDGLTVMAIPINDRRNVDTILNTIFEAENDLIALFDMPAGASEHLKKEFEVFSALLNLPEVDTEFLWTLNTERAGVRQLDNMIEIFGDVKGRFTVVRNHFYGDDWAIYEDSKTRKKLKELRPDTVEADLPEIPDDVLKSVGQKSFHDIATNRVADVKFTDRVRISGIFNQAKEGFSHLIPQRETKQAKGKKETQNA